MELSPMSQSSTAGYWTPISRQFQIIFFRKREDFQVFCDKPGGLVDARMLLLVTAHCVIATALEIKVRPQRKQRGLHASMCTYVRACARALRIISGSSPSCKSAKNEGERN